MTDRTQPDSGRATGAAHIIRYALELGLLWIDGDGRDKVREALDALDILEAQLEAVGAGGVHALSAAPAGWELVPVNPDISMQIAAKKADMDHSPLPDWLVGDWPEFLRIWNAMLAASPTPPAEQPIGEVVVTKTRDGQIVSVTRQDDEGRILSVIATSDPVEQQAAPKAAPGEQGYREKWDAELGRTAMRFVDRAGDVHPGIDDAETICAEFHKAMSEVIERMPHVQRMAAPKAAPQQEAQERATVPRFNCWSTNEGDSWFDHPADSQAIYDCLGNDAKVGDEYELTAGWKSVTARYRITEVVGDGEEYEVECISHPQGKAAPQPAPAPLSGDAKDAARYRWLRNKSTVLHGTAWLGSATAYQRDVGFLRRDDALAALDAAIDAALGAQGGKV